MMASDMEVFLEAQARLNEILYAPSHATLPTTTSLEQAAQSLYQSLPSEGVGLQRTSQHLFRDVVPGLNGSSLSPTYYGFVTGGITPAARLAESVVTLFDQNVCVHLPKESVATVVEHRALCMLLELVGLEPARWPSRTLTTGATASNILGLACAREYVTLQKLFRAGLEPRSGEGLLSSCLRAGIETFQILTTLPHSSLGKAANIVGLGSATMIDVSKQDHFLDFDLESLEKHLALPKTASIVVISCGEVNTGAFATHSVEEVQRIRDLCTRHGAWLHVDAAFGFFARALPEAPHYAAVRSGTDCLNLADSITGDAHKLLNVPYDCGFFFCRHEDVQIRVFQNTNAAYLSGGPSDGITSSLNIRLENSARFRGLPVYTTLVNYGKIGYAAMIARMVDLARKIAVHIRDECSDLELLPRGVSMDAIYMCVLFRARHAALNDVLTERIKASRKLYASGTVWEGVAAVRFAVAKWDVDIERDFNVVKNVISNAVK